MVATFNEPLSEAWIGPGGLSEVDDEREEDVQEKGGWEEEARCLLPQLSLNSASSSLPGRSSVANPASGPSRTVSKLPSSPPAPASDSTSSSSSYAAACVKPLPPLPNSCILTSLKAETGQTGRRRESRKSSGFRRQSEEASYFPVSPHFSSSGCQHLVNSEEQDLKQAFTNMHPARLHQLQYQLRPPHRHKHHYPYSINHPRHQHHSPQYHHLHSVLTTKESQTCNPDTNRQTSNHPHRLLVACTGRLPSSKGTLSTVGMPLLMSRRQRRCDFGAFEVRKGVGFYSTAFFNISLFTVMLAECYS
ncbi:unnamed protein product [Protopolystoma xenopodis]|uniref:Uncharacterized protein n=1 Tax=Protopolystoma xenopodis TaxID=117903 RepID=A0A3S5AM92_9PLAT|nr:unnamed protein product [Protopolystoma xenopodis]